MNQFNKRVKTGNGNIFNTNRTQGDITIPIANDLDTSDLDTALGASQGIVLRNISENLQLDINAIDADVSGFATRMTEAETDIGVLQSTTTAMGLEVDSLLTRTTNLESAVISINSSITSLGSRMTTAEGEIDVLQADSGSQAAAIVTLDSRVDAIDADITSIDTDIYNLQGTVATHTVEIGTNASNIFSVNTQVGVNTGNITTLQGTVSSQGSSISSLSGTVASNTSAISTLTGTVGTQGTAISSLNSTVTDVTTGNAALGTRMTSAESAISSIVAGDFALAAGSNIGITGTSVKTIAVSSAPTFSGAVTCDTLETASGRLDIHPSVYAPDVRYESTGAHRFFVTGQAQDAVAINDTSLYVDNIRYYSSGITIHGPTQLSSSTHVDDLVLTGTGTSIAGSIGYSATHQSPDFYNGTRREFLAPPAYMVNLVVGLSSGSPYIAVWQSSRNPSCTVSSTNNDFTVNLPTDICLHAASLGYGYCPMVMIQEMSNGTQSNVRIKAVGVISGNNFIFEPSINGASTTFSAVTSGLLNLQIIFHPTLM